MMLHTLSTIMRGGCDASASDIAALKTARMDALKLHREQRGALQASAAPKAFAELTGHLPQLTPGYA